MTSLATSPPGVLYLVATPIGNRDDMSIRGVRVLQSVDFILAEDTRHSSPLLVALGVKKPLLSLHAHNEADVSALVLQRIIAGETAALISDAGTPLISDPGYPLVRLARDQGVTVVPIPGACALITALCAAGVPCDVFTFVGFLPAKRTARCRELTQLTQLTHTIVFYESTHRIRACMEDISAVYGPDCELVLAKELTKAFECIIRDTVTALQAWFAADKTREKGEFVLIIPARKVSPTLSIADQYLSVLRTELPLKQAVSLAAKLSGTSKNALYARALAQNALGSQ